MTTYGATSDDKFLKFDDLLLSVILDMIKIRNKLYIIFIKYMNLFLIKSSVSDKPLSEPMVE